ncbi:MAG: THUMP domain-containing protein [Bacteroidota bacterium]|nr:THUMP domain-containing protein [Bacteroidota bacterium]
MAFSSGSSSSLTPYLATTLFGLETVLAQELEKLGAQNIKVGNRAVEFAGDKQLLYKANLWCRTAIRILKPFRTFTARDERDLYRQVSKINWQDHIRSDQTFAIQSVVSQSTFEHSLFVSQLAKDAIVDQFRQRTGQRPSVNVEQPDVRLNLHMLENWVTLSLDASGDSLHRRGYRQQTNVAPLSEVLAAGILLLTGWDKQVPLIDPMCGSGTFLTEAALLAHNIAPGLYRRNYFGFMNWPDFEEGLYHTVLKDAEAAQLPDEEVDIVGSDIDKDYIEAARRNITHAGLEDFIRVRVRDLKDAQGIGEKGVVIVNPPYGERISPDNLNQLYKLIGDTFKTNFSGYDAFVFTGNLEAAKHIGLKTSRRIPLYNGPIECRLLKYELYRGTRKQVAPEQS